MTKALLIYLALNTLAYSLPSSYVASLLSIGHLINHFHDHRNGDHHLSLLKFLRSHYFDKTHHESDHDEHCKLPFQHNHHESLNITQSLSGLPPIAIGYPSSNPFSHSSLPVIKSPHWVSACYLDDIWQPPKA